MLCKNVVFGHLATWCPSRVKSKVMSCVKSIMRENPSSVKSKIMRFMLSVVTWLPFTELCPLPYQLLLSSADEDGCHKTGLDTNEWLLWKAYLLLVLLPLLFKPSSPNMGSLYQVREMLTGVVWSIHTSKEFAIAAQFSWDWFPGRRLYPIGHRSLAAKICLNIPDDCNRDSRVFIGQSQDKRFQIGKNCDWQHINRLIGCCSDLEVLNQPLLPVFEFTCQIICLNGIFRRRLGRQLCRATPGRPATIRQQPPAPASAGRRGAMATARARSPVCGPDRS